MNTRTITRKSSLYILLPILVSLSMKNTSYILLIFLTSLFSCAAKKNKEETTNLKDMIVYLAKDNDKVVQVMKKEVMEEGNKPSGITILDQAKEIISKRNSLRPKASFLIDYYTFLKAEYSMVEEKDSSRLKRAEQLITIFQTEKDSLVYYNTFTNLLLIENDILKALSMKVGTSCRWSNVYAKVYKEQDTINSNETYSMVIVPDMHCGNKIDTKMDSNIKVFYNSTRVDIPVTIEKAGGLIILKLSPKNPGNYKIVGELTLRSQLVDFTITNSYSDTFHVK